MIGENGILTFDTGIPGKIVTVIACTHADEIIGFNVVKFLINNFDIKNKLKSGKLNIIIGNLKGLEIGKKYVDKDFNRIWDFKEEDKNTYEYKRANEIKEKILESDFLLDQHSTTNKAPFFIIPASKFEKNFLKNFNIDFVIEDILNFLHGKPLVGYVVEKNPNTKAMVFECFYENEEDFKRYTNNVVLWLNETGIIDEKLHFEVDKKDVTFLKTVEAKYAKTMDVKFLYSKNPQSFDKISKGQEVYKDGENIFKSEEDFVILMPTKPRYIGEEIMYKLKNV